MKYNDTLYSYDYSISLIDSEDIHKIIKMFTHDSKYYKLMIHFGTITINCTHVGDNNVALEIGTSVEIISSCAIFKQIFHTMKTLKHDDIKIFV